MFFSLIIHTTTLLACPNTLFVTTFDWSAKQYLVIYMYQVSAHIEITGMRRLFENTDKGAFRKHIMGISYIINHRSASPERERNLYTVVDYLLKNFPDIEIIVIEQATKRSLTNLPQNAKHLLLPNDGLFRRAWGFNVGFHLATHNILAFGDNDLVVPAHALLQSAVDCVKYGTTSPYPSGTVLDLTQTATNHFIETQLVTRRLQHTRRVSPYAGGIVFFTKQAFEAVGGWEEKICGWGGEDDHMTIKIKKILGSIHEVRPSFALHLYHPGSNVYQQALAQNPHYLKNLEQIRLVKKMTSTELHHMCKQIWPQIGKIPSYFEPEHLL